VEPEWAYDWKFVNDENSWNFRSLLGTGTKIKLHIAPSYLDLKKYLYYYNI
jgi:hypothetical protein